jgi:transcriptional regulator with XRE-family HTH domain
VTAALPPVGDRIREARAHAGVSVRGLARAIGVSPSLISQIETGKSRPSVSTLYSITKALGISVEELFDAESPPVRSAPMPDVVHNVALLRHTGPVVRPAEREILELDSGVTWERLGRVSGAHVDFLLVTYAPGSSSSGSGLLMRHSGVEFGYLISGELTMTLGFEEHRLVPGDAVSFPSSTPHSYRNDGVEPAIGIWFVHEDDDLLSAT